MKAWLEHHLHSFVAAGTRLRNAPFASLFSVVVIGIALSLPAGLYLLLSNVERLAGGIPTRPEITLYLKTDLAEGNGRRLARELSRRKDLEAVRFIAKDEGLRRLENSGMADITRGLANNPLPDAISMIPKSASAASLDSLAAEFRALPGVEQVATDADWARRLDALLGFGQDLVWMLAGLLGIALAAITGNTIRLQIYALRDEVEVSRLIGATDRFIRRPFLYFGALQGLLGGVASLGILAAGVAAIGASLDRLAIAWGARLQLQGLSPAEAAALLAAATLLGLIGAYLAVNYSLRKLD